MAALTLLLAGCGGNPDRVTSLPDENRVVEAEDPTPAPVPTPEEPASGNAAVAPEPAASPPAGNAFAPLEPRGEREGDPESLLPDALSGERGGAAVLSSGRYRCPQGADFAATVDRRYDVALVSFADGTAARLEGQPGGSGAWYRGEGYDLRGRRGGATLTDPAGNVSECSVSR